MADKKFVYEEAVAELESIVNSLNKSPFFTALITAMYHSMIPLSSIQEEWSWRPYAMIRSAKSRRR